MADYNCGAVAGRAVGGGVVEMGGEFYVAAEEGDVLG